MIKINTEKLSGEQVNAIILLVRENRGKVYASPTTENELELDLSFLKLREEIKLRRKIRHIKKLEGST